MPEKVKVPLSWALEQAGTLAQLWMRDNAPKPCTTEAFCDLFLKSTFEIMGRMTGMSFRVPTNDVSVVDLTARLKQPASYHDVCVAMENAAQNSMKGIITCTNDQVVSSDLTGFSETCIFDETAGIMLDDNFVKLIAWYDNEWGYSNKLLDLIAHMYAVDQQI